MTSLVEINVKGFLCSKKTSICGQNHKVANSEGYWTLLTKEKLSGVILKSVKFTSVNFVKLSIVCFNLCLLVTK